MMITALCGKESMHPSLKCRMSGQENVIIIV